MIKVGRNQPCPCGSGKKYKHCCYGKPFSWEIDDEGNLHQVFPVEGGLKESLDSLRKDFMRHFEREPTGSDPLYLGKYLYSPEDMKRLTVEAMEEAGTDPAHIYAYRKTGYLIVDSYANRATGAALKEWDEAVEEFDRQGGDPEEGSEGQEFDRLLDDLVEEIDSLIFLLGLANDNFLNTPLLPGPTEDLVLSPAQYQALCVVRTHRTLRSIRTLLHEHMTEDVLKLARSIYENYLHMEFVAANPEKVRDLVDAVIGLRSGTHTYKTTQAGKIDKRTIREVVTGNEYAGHISAYRMAEASSVPEDLAFFDFFYEKTSQFLHPSVFALDGYISEHGLDPVKPHVYEEGVLFSVVVASMVADRIPHITGCPANVIADARTVLTRIKKKTLDVLARLQVWQTRIGADLREIALLKERCDRIAAG